MYYLVAFGTLWYIILFALAWLLLYNLISQKKVRPAKSTRKRVVSPPNLSEDQVKLPIPKENLSVLLKKMNEGDITWPEFSLEYEKRNAQFIQNFRNLEINHTPNVMKHAICIRMNLTLKETASILNVSISSVKNARNRLKKQLALGPTDSIQKFIHQL